MPESRVWFSLVALVSVSLIGEYARRTLNGADDQERLLDIAATGVGELPTRIGRWRMVNAEPLDEAARNILKCRAHESRNYVDEQTGDNISLVLLAGVAGPIVAHTPEACYSSTEYEIDEAAKTEVVRNAAGRLDNFGRVVFRSNALAGRRMEVFYAWRKHDGPWEAPQSPRLALGGQPMLFKLQLAIASSEDSRDRSYASDAIHRFLTELLPVLDQILTVE